MSRFNLFNLCNLLTISCATAQVQEAWLTRYNDGRPNSTNRAVAVAVDSSGNVLVAGSSIGTAGDFDYVTIKYNPAGTQLWAKRYASGVGSDDQVRALAVDSDGNVVATGTSDTIKYDGNGAFLWAASYGGRALAVDPAGNAYVTGFRTNEYATVKLDSNGSNLWLRTYNYLKGNNASQPDVATMITLDARTNVYIAGFVTCALLGHGFTDVAPVVVAYTRSGDPIWASSPSAGRGCVENIADVRGVAADIAGNAYVASNLRGSGGNYVTMKFDPSGSFVWLYYLEGGEVFGVTAMAHQALDYVYLTGFSHAIGATRYGTVKLSTTGVGAWTNYYLGGSKVGAHGANAIALDNTENVYVTGVSPGTNSGNDFATIKYDTNGNEKWVKRYDGPAHGDDQATAIAVDSTGSVFVTGFSQNASGGYDLTTIKYAELQSIQLLTNGHAFLQFFGTPGQSYRFQATTNFPNWTDIGSSFADSSGVYRFEDTNAPAYPHRFYRTVSP